MEFRMAAFLPAAVTKLASPKPCVSLFCDWTKIIRSEGPSHDTAYPLGSLFFSSRGVGKHALPGGFVKIGETVASACRREVKEETGIEIAEISLVGVYSDIHRDPRGHIVSVAFMTEFTNETAPRAGSDARSAEWINMGDTDLAFDHARIFADAKDKLRIKNAR